MALDWADIEEIWERCWGSPPAYEYFGKDSAGEWYIGATQNGNSYFTFTITPSATTLPVWYSGYDANGPEGHVNPKSEFTKVWQRHINAPLQGPPIQVIKWNAPIDPFSSSERHTCEYAHPVPTGYKLEPLSQLYTEEEQFYEAKKAFGRTIRGYPVCALHFCTVGLVRRGNELHYQCEKGKSEL